ncbi:MAG TPA: (2Fe-2S) ferredoxin domain-containing protein, partial [Bacillota bacterium]|nr:(2Fe-2S) ferredoxin domain-containing protein [Bacillota bacterium]
KKLDVKVCVGTSCMIRGSQHLLQGLMEHIEDRRMSSCVDIKATFCFEACDLGPTVSIGDKVIRKCTMQQALDTLDAELAAMGAVAD